MKRAWSTEKSMAVVFAVAALFCFSAAFVTGCAKKEAVKEEMPVVKEKAPEPTAPAKMESKKPEAAPQPMKEQAEGMTKMEAAAPAKAAYEFSDIHFDFDKYNLRPEDREILKKHAEWLTANKNYSVRIEGNCDERGTVEYNLALGEKRAREAKKYLVELGVDEARISTVSYGKERPLDSGHNEEAWAKNRRDHFAVSPAQ